MRLCQDAVADISTQQKQFISVTKGLVSSTASGATLFFFYWRENESKRASLDVMHSFPIHKSLELKSSAVVICGYQYDALQLFFVIVLPYIIYCLHASVLIFELIFVVAVH